MIHVFNNNDSELVVADNKKEAIKLLKKCFGDDIVINLTQLNDKDGLTIYDEDYPTIRTTQTCKEWCKFNGKGILGRGNE